MSAPVRANLFLILLQTTNPYYYLLTLVCSVHTHLLKKLTVYYTVLI